MCCEIQTYPVMDVQNVYAMIAIHVIPGFSPLLRTVLEDPSESLAL